MEDWQEPQGARDAATVLPFAAAALLLPPVILIFATPAMPGGVPLIIAYIFAVWGATILAAFLLARRLARRAPRDPDAPPEA